MMSVVSARSGIAGAELVDELEIALAAVGSPHRLQDPGRARLERQVRVLADCSALGHGGDHFSPEVLRMGAREADALDPDNRVAGSEELAEPGLHVGPEVAAPRVDVLPEKRDLPYALVGEARHLGEDLPWSSAHLAPAHGGHDAVRADRVAAHRDLHPGLEAALAVHRQRAGELALLARAEAPARRLAACAEPLREVRDRAGAKRDVDVGVEIEEPLSLSLCVASPDRDHLVGIGDLQHPRLAEVHGEALIRLLADRAGVEDDDVSLFLRGRLPQSELLEHALDPLRVVSVHLAPESSDVVALHSR